MLNGPPLPAPPSFTGLALAGLAALPLIEEEARWLTAIPATTCLRKRNSPSWNDQDPRRDRRAARHRSRYAIVSLPMRSGRRCAPSATALSRSRPRGRIRCRSPPWSTKSCIAVRSDGYRDAGCRPCGRLGGAVLRRSMPKPDARHGCRFHELSAASRTLCSTAVQTATSASPAWGDMPPKAVLRRSACCTTLSAPITPIPTPGTKSASAARPARAAMCGINFDRRDPVGSRRSAARHGGRGAAGERPCRMIREHTPRAIDGRAPDVFSAGGLVPMRQYADDEAVDFAIVGTGAGGGTLACKLAEYGFSVVALDAGPYWRPLEDFASDEHHQSKLYWTDERIVDGENPFQLGANNSGKSVGGSTVHFAMVSLRFRPEWFKARTKLGYGADWPLDWREMWLYYDEVEAGAEDFRPGQLSVGTETAALSLSAARTQCRGAGAGGRRRSARHRLDADAARHCFGAARPFASLRLSRHVRDRLLDQCQAERAHHLAAAGACRRRRNPRPRHGRAHRARRLRPRHRRALSSAKDAGASSARAMSSSPVMRSKRRDCCSIPRPTAFPTALPTVPASSART